MLRLTLKDLWAHKRRLASTVAAVFIGVAFLAGTLALSDTLRSNFDDLFTEANAGTDAVIRSTTSIDADTRGPVGAGKRGLVDASLVPTLQQVDGVASASASIEGYGQLLGRDGEAIGGVGPPRRAGNWITDPDLNPYRIVDGRPPQADDEVVINRGAAKDGDLHVGDTTVVQTPDPVTVRIVGIATYGSADGAGQTTFTAFTLPAAQRYLAGGADEATSILVHGDGDLSQEQLTDQLRPLLPAGTEAITGAAATQQNIDDINATFLDALTAALTVFAGVALLVGAFSIFNTFSILVAQRTRQSALLRAIGASRRQVVRSVVIEAVLIGAVASIAGLGGGIAVAGLLKAMFDAFGFALPAGGLTITSTSMIVPLVVGTLVTVAASIGPALRASRVPPLAALRDVAVDRAGTSPARAVAGAVVIAAGAALTLLGAVGAELALAGLGALLTVVGVVVFGPVVARAASGIIGRPVRRLRGVTGALARDNAMRSPRRTAGTASALMVGVAVVTLFTVFAASLKSSINDAVERSFAGDLAVTTGTFSGALSPQLATDLAALPDVSAAAGLGRGVARVAGQDESVTVADPSALAQVLDLDVRDGALAGLDAGGLAVSTSAASSHHWTVGSEVPVTFTDGTTADLRVGAIYGDDDLPGPYVVPRAAWAPHAVQDLDATVYVALADGVSLADGTAAVEAVAARYGHPDVLDRAGFVAQSTGRINVVLGLVYVMLALAVVIALLGIANTLSLSILERTRELGLLRAVGATKARLRSMVRWESVIIALFGTAGGLGVGLFLGWALTAVALDTGAAFTAPVAQLAVVLIAGGVAGVLAAVRPARRAGRLDVLAAIATE